ncbi:MAG: DUF3450 family protein [Thiohalospira sp.]
MKNRFAPYGVPAVLLAGLIAAGPAAAQSSGSSDEGAESLAEELVALRSEVQDLSETLSDERTDHRDRMKRLARQEAELAGEAERARSRLRELESDLDDYREALERAGANDEELTPEVLAAAEALEERIEAGLPFKRDERRKAVTEIADDLRAEAIPPQDAVKELWALVETELRMTRENSIHSQTIALDGEDTKVDVARIGMVALYFRTRDGRFGAALPDGDGWTFSTYKDGTRAEQVEKLFSDLEKQIRTGHFTLPVAMPLEEALQ